MKKTTPWKGIATIFIISVLAVLGLLFLIYQKESQPNTNTNSWFGYLALSNSLLNSASAISLIIGRWAIAKRKILLHKKMMITAFVFSSLFLINYIYYHYYQGSTAFQGEGWIRPIYFFILISHLILSAITLPIVLLTFYFAFYSHFRLHKSIAHYTVYMWLYVSVTGVLIYLLLQIFNP